MNVDQQSIAHWFDKTYSTRGYGYLRPVEAYYIFHTLLSPKTGEKLLDVACGPGVLIRAFQNLSNLDFHGIDISTKAIEMAHKFCPEAHVQVANAEHIPYSDEFFDLVTCIGSLERMMDRPRVLSEIKRVTKPEATICFMVRNDQHLTWRYLLHPLGLRNKNGHQDAMSLETWRTLFTNNGFRIKEVHPDHWPWYRFLKTVMLWKKIDTSRIRTFRWDIQEAYEFIFILEKNG